MRRVASALPALALLQAGAPLSAATVLQKTVEVEIRGDGSVSQHTHLEVRLDTGTDLRAWSPYPIVEDENRQILGVTAWVRRPDGSTEKLGRKDFDTADLASEMVLHTSGKVRLVRFPEAAPGAVLGLDYDQAERPWFSAGRVALGAGEAAISHLRVRVRGGGAGWRWSVLGSTAGLAVSEAPGEVTITGGDLPRPADLEHAPDEVREGPVLRFGWREPATWAAVGRWYDELSRGVPRHGEDVRLAARRVLDPGGAGNGSEPGTAGPAAAGPAATAGDDGRRRRQLESILAFVRREVRYVAVEVGIGGYRPAAAHETLSRRWGDCKGKAELLLDLLDEAGIEAFPALLRSGSGNRIDPDFPAPTSFNHMIVALPVAGLAVAPDDPVAGGYLFVDPTQRRGSGGWLHPADQDQWALVLRGERSALVRTPLRPRLEGSRLTLELVVRPDGTAAGQLRLELRGGFAAAQADRLEAERPETIDAEAHRLIATLLPAATATAPRWLPAADDAGVPAVTLTAAVSLPALVAAAADGGGAADAAAGATAGGATAGGAAGTAPAPARSLALAGPGVTPSPGLLRGRLAPVVLRPQVAAVTWQLTLPAG
ncbi:MAG TPA: DUF3857 domain-containing protein, partial [Thermoanaerobaculia bacterium]|nr:DUF3857 domain-containing protein [Thermoanaerobaculia bacterium]